MPSACYRSSFAPRFLCFLFFSTLFFFPVFDSMKKDDTIYLIKKIHSCCTSLARQVGKSPSTFFVAFLSRTRNFVGVFFVASRRIPSHSIDVCCFSVVCKFKLRWIELSKVSLYFVQIQIPNFSWIQWMNFFPPICFFLSRCSWSWWLWYVITVIWFYWSARSVHYTHD